MPSFVHDPGKWSQGLEELASLHAQNQNDLSRCPCPSCDGALRRIRRRHRFGVVSSADDFLLRTGYHCACIPAFWVINPETGKKWRGVVEA